MWVSKIVTSLWPGAVALKPLPMNTVTDARRKYSLNIDRHHLRVVWSGCEFVTQCLQLEAHWPSGTMNRKAVGMVAVVMREALVHSPRHSRFL